MIKYLIIASILIKLSLQIELKVYKTKLIPSTHKYATKKSHEESNKLKNNNKKAKIKGISAKEVLIGSSINLFFVKYKVKIQNKITTVFDHNIKLVFKTYKLTDILLS